MWKYSLVISLCALGIAVFASDFVKKDGEYIYEDSLTFDRDASSFTRLEVETVNGGVSVKSWDANSIHVVAYRVVRCEDTDEGREYLKDFEPAVKDRGSSLVIETKYPKDKWGDSDQSAWGNINYEISAPRTLSLEIGTVNGSILVGEMNGEMDLSSVNGGVTVHTTEGLTGRASLSTVNGGVELMANMISGKSSLESVNGGIEMRLSTSLSGDIELSTVNGGIEIMLPQSADMRLKAEVAMSGSIKSDWGSVNEGSMFGESLDYTTGTGEHRVSLESVNGSIEIRTVRAN
jgi:DUF4097 and DUF4098 domain-containing protein YvlB